MKRKKNEKKALTNAKLTQELHNVQKQIAIFRKRWAKQQKRTLDKYYSWQNYFTEKRRRFKARYKAVERKAQAFESTLKRLKRLHFLHASPGYKAKDGRKKYVLLVTRSDALRLRRFLQSKHYHFSGNVGKGRGFAYLTPEEKVKLRWFLSKDWRKKK